MIGRRVKQALKLLRLLRRSGYRRGLCFGVGAAVEHEALFAGKSFATLVDVGANTGQFSLLARTLAPGCRIIAFEPLARPARVFCRLFSGDARTTLHRCALGLTAGTAAMNVSRRDDNSSLLEIGPGQVSFAPGTEACGTESVAVAPLVDFIGPDDIVSPALLKIDVQGYEATVLAGAVGLLRQFEYIYCESSFVELYIGQPFISSIIETLRVSGFVLVSVDNVCHGRDGLPVQADFLFRRAVAIAD